MKKLFILSVFLLFAQTINSQWIIESFDSSAGVFFIEPEPVGNSYLHFFNDTSHFEGNGSLKINYLVEANSAFGGILTDTYNSNGPNVPYFDLSDGISLKFWYKIVNPIIMDEPGEFNFMFKIEEVDSNGNIDFWYHYFQLNLIDNSGQWKPLEMQLVPSSDPTIGFTLQFGDGDGILQKENIRGFQFVFIYTPYNLPAVYPKAHGSFLIDRLELIYPSSVINEETKSPNQFALEQNYPNPFNPSTKIQYTIGSNQFVQLKIYDLLGREVKTLVSEYRDAGSYNVDFDASNLTSGIYLYKLQAGDFVQTKKMLLMK